MDLSRDTAWALLAEFTQNENLQKHALAVEAAVRGYARLWGEDEAAWGVTALLHDFDYERYPDLADHPFKGAGILRERGSPEWLVRAVLSHADHTGVARETRLEHTLFACDEMAGFVTAASLIRPSKSLLGPRGEVGREADEGKSLRQGRQPRRPAPRRRGDRGPLDTHVANVIAFMREHADALGLGATCRASGFGMRRGARLQVPVRSMNCR